LKTKSKSNHHKWIISGIVVVVILLLVAIFGSVEWSSVGKGGSIGNICVDDDGGKIFEEQGRTTGLIRLGSNEITTEEDICSNGKIVEYECDNSVVIWDTYDCPDGKFCKNGACVDDTKVSSLREEQTLPTCTGLVPLHATICSMDRVGLTADTPIITVSTCTSANCEYKCNPGYIPSSNNIYNNNNICVAQTTTPPVDTAPLPAAKCTGIVPANAKLCFGDGRVSTNTPITLVSACTAAKCEYICKDDSTLTNGACVVESSTSPYTRVSDADLPNVDLPSICIGTTPGNATLCEGDNSGLTTPVIRSLVSDCTEVKCEYTCNLGYTLRNNTCVRIKLMPNKLPITEDGSQSISNLKPAEYDLLNTILTIMNNQDTSFQKLSALAALIRENIELFE